MRKPVLVVTAYFVDAVEARLKQDFELRRKKNGAHFTLEELLSAADGSDENLQKCSVVQRVMFCERPIPVCCAPD